MLRPINTYLHIFFGVRVNLSVNLNDLWTFKPILSSFFVWGFLSLRHSCKIFWSASKQVLLLDPLAIKIRRFLCNRSMKTGSTQDSDIVWARLRIFHQRQTVIPKGIFHLACWNPLKMHVSFWKVYKIMHISYKHSTFSESCGDSVLPGKKPVCTYSYRWKYRCKHASFIVDV